MFILCFSLSFSSPSIVILTFPIILDRSKTHIPASVAWAANHLKYSV